MIHLTDTATTCHQSHGLGPSGRFGQTNRGRRHAGSECDSRSCTDADGLRQEELVVPVGQAEHHDAKHLQMGAEQQEYPIPAMVKSWAGHHSS